MLKSKKETKPKDDVLQAVKAVKEGKRRKLHVTVFPKEGGRPFLAEVEPDDEGSFKLSKDHPGSYEVERGSVWEEGDGKLRAIVNEGNPKTVNAYTLVGDDSFDPVALNGVASNNLWVQLADLARRKNAWRQISTWGFITIGVIVILVLIWQVRTTGQGLEDLRGAIETMQVAGGGGDPPASPSGSGHNPIAPGSGG